MWKCPRKKGGEKSKVSEWGESSTNWVHSNIKPNELGKNTSQRNTQRARSTFNKYSKERHSKEQENTKQFTFLLAVGSRGQLETP